MRILALKIGDNLIWYGTLYIYRLSTIQARHNVCCYVSCLNDALPAHILNSLATPAKDSWFHSFVFQFAKQRGATLNLNNILSYVLLRVHDGFWKIISAQSHLTVLVLASADFLSSSKSLKIFQNPEWNHELPP